jgi:hypothetical protein
MQPGGFTHPSRYDTSDVVTSPLYIRQEPGERGTVDDVRAAFRTLAVPDRRDVREIGRDFDAASVV